MIEVKGGYVKLTLIPPLCKAVSFSDDAKNTIIPGDVMDQAVSIVLSGDQDRGFVSYRGCSSSLFTCSTLDMERILEADHLHIAGYFALPGLWKVRQGPCLPSCH